MNLLEFFDEVDDLKLQVIITIALLILYLTANKISSKVIKAYGKKNSITLPRVVYTKKYFQFVLVVFFLLSMGLIWGVSFEGLSVYFLSFFTVAGVALFANWSILSNVTAAVILFFNFPYRIGDRIKIVDGDNSIEGIIFDLNMFSMIIKNDDGKKVTYPNNMALQKAIILLESH
jgi:small-conductance mechanosensitive channel